MEHGIYTIIDVLTRYSLQELKPSVHIGDRNRVGRKSYSNGKTGRYTDATYAIF
jgi:hypothetical protein